MPDEETTGIWASWSLGSSSLARLIDIVDSVDSLGLPGTDLVNLQQTHDDLDRLTGVVADAGHTVSFTWRGSSRLYGTAVGSGLGSITQGMVYEDETGLLERLTHSFGSSLKGGLSYGWTGDEGLRSFWGRIASSPESGASASGLTSSMGWTWGYDVGQRMEEAVSGSVSGLEQAPEAAGLRAWAYGYGSADELTGISETDARSQGQHTELHPGALCHLEAITYPDGLEAVVRYSSSGRRIEDDRFQYTSTWRGELVEVVIKDDSEGLAGHRVVYEHDALGRVVQRTHLDAGGAFVDARGLIWDGWDLAAVLGLNHQSEVLWTKQLIPGPGGLDSSPVMRVTTTELHANGPSEPWIALIRDELGTVIGITQVYAAEGEQLPGALRIRATLPLDLVAARAHLRIEERIEDERWPVPADDMVLGYAAEDPATLHIMPINGWQRGQHLRFTLTPQQRENRCSMLGLHDHARSAKRWEDEELRSSILRNAEVPWAQVASGGGWLRRMLTFRRHRRAARSVGPDSAVVVSGAAVAQDELIAIPGKALEVALHGDEERCELLVG